MLKETLLIEESVTDESLDSFRPTEILAMLSCSVAHSFVCSLRPVTLAFVPFFVFFISPDQLQENRATEKLSLRLKRIAKQVFFFRRIERKFHQKVNAGIVVNFPCTDWLSCLRTQSNTVLVWGVVCEARDFS